MKKPEDIRIRMNRSCDKNGVLSEGMGSWSQLNLFFKPRNLLGNIFEGNLKLFQLCMQMLDLNVLFLFDGFYYGLGVKFWLRLIEFGLSF
jgi:hypothetical protein